MKKIIILLIVVLLGFGCGERKETEIKAPGIVDGNIITLKSQVSGTIDELLMEEGETVTRDDVIAKINSDKIKNQLMPQMHGGKQERGLRSGTLPTHQIVGMGEAFKIAKKAIKLHKKLV